MKSKPLKWVDKDAMIRGVGKRLREARETRGFTQVELASRCYLQGQAISHFESGRRVPSLGNFVRLVCALGCEMEWLAAGSGPQRKNQMSKDVKLQGIN